MLAAVREWYSLEGAGQRFDAPDLECRQEWSVKRLLDPEWEEAQAAEWVEAGWPQLAESIPVLSLLGELLISVPLCGDDDPHVFDYGDPNIKCERFSAFIHGMIQYILDHREDGPGR